MLERKSKNTQNVDAHLMDSLNAIHPIDSGQFFPVSKKTIWRKSKNKLSKVPEPVLPPQSTLPPTANSSALNPERATEAPVEPPEQGASKKPLILLAPLGLFLVLFLTSIVVRSLGLPYMSTDAEAILAILLSVVEIPCLVALALYYLGNIRRKYIFAPAAGLTRSHYNERFIPVGLIVWPLALMVLYMIVLVAFPSGDITLGPLNGLLYLLVITGFPSFAFGLILFALLLAYKKEVSITYPSFIFTAIDYVNRKFS